MTIRSGQSHQGKLFQGHWDESLVELLLHMATQDEILAWIENGLAIRMKSNNE